MIKYIFVLAVFCSGLFFSTIDQDIALTGAESVQTILEQLGDERSSNYPESVDPGPSVELGESIVKTGVSRNLRGGKTKKQSKHFVCTSCHNVEKESSYLNLVDPQERLEYTAEKGLPFVQGSPLFGIVNRTSFYNQDYEKKYGDLVLKARNDLRESIQLCAVECSQGRALKPWEMESILMYLWTIDIKVNDLVLSEADIDLVEGALSNQKDKADAIELLKSKYLDYSPAHFVDPPQDRRNGISTITPDVQNGALIYENACLYCHQKNDYSFYELTKEKLSFRQLKNNMRRYDQRSMYQVIRYGTQPMGGKKAYMPHYTIEKMSLQQQEDLRAYIYQQAE